MNNPITLSSKQVCAVSGASYRQLDYWSLLGLLTGEPMGARTIGSGFKRIHTFEEAVLARILVVGGSIVYQLRFDSRFKDLAQQFHVCYEEDPNLLGVFFLLHEDRVEITSKFAYEEGVLLVDVFKCATDVRAGLNGE
jgi:hypothetical protein